VLAGVLYVINPEIMLTIATNSVGLWIIAAVMVFYAVVWAVLTFDTMRLVRLVNDLLDVARIDRGVFEFRPELVDVRALVSDVVGVLESPQHPIQLRVEDGERILVPADPARLRQCLENLIANATQQSPAATPVSIFLRRARGPEQEPRVTIEVVDEGPGIPPDFLPHLFERFSTRERGGLGLGLYIAKRIAMAHGGDLTVASQPGKGARFILSLLAEAK
jgi:signal transduction histidine kinase